MSLLRDRLRAYFKKTGKPQYEVAAKAHVSASQLSHILRDGDPRESTIAKVNKALDALERER